MPENNESNETAQINKPTSTQNVTRWPMIPQVVRTRFLQYVLSTPNKSIRSAALTFGLKTLTAHAIVGRYEESGEMTPRTKGGPTNKKMTKEAYNALERWVDEDAGLTLRCIKMRRFEQLNIAITEKTVSVSLSKVGFTLKSCAHCRFQETLPKR